MNNIRYKLTTQNKTTHNGFQLPEDGVWYYPEDTTSAPKECSNTVLHHYAHPLLAVLFNPIHGNYKNPRLFEIEIDAELGTDGLKGWCRAQRIVKEIELPVLTPEQKVAFAIYCAEPFGDERWQKWATNWMNGADRSALAALAAYAARADFYAAYAAHAAAARDASYALFDAARTAINAANADYYAAYTAYSAAKVDQKRPDFVSIIQKVVDKQ